jgi:hypothetical protein
MAISGAIMRFFNWFRAKYGDYYVDFLATGIAICFSITGFMAFIGLSADVGWMIWPYMLLCACIAMSGMVWAFWFWAKFMSQVLTEYRQWRDNSPGSTAHTHE